MKFKNPAPTDDHHAHVHGSIDRSVLTTDRGLWAVKWSFMVLALTSLLQLMAVKFSGSVSLLADTIHNFGDAATAIPLGIAFVMAKTKPNKRFTYGMGRVEDFAGVVVVLTILISAMIAGHQSILRFLHPQKVRYLPAVMAASIIGFIGNEAVAIFRIKVGNEIGSATLVADGHHARVDGFTSLAVLFGAIGIWLGFPLVDPVMGLAITIAILKIVWDSGATIFSRLLDGIEPEVIEEIRHVANHVPQVREVSEVRARWIGHKIHAELNVAVNPHLTVEQAHEIAKEVKHQLMHHLKYLSNAIVHVDPINASGEKFHDAPPHEHGDLSLHSHK